MWYTEPGFKKWFERSPEVRKEIVLVTKDNPRVPRDMLGLLDKRLAALSTDYVDLFFIHGLGDDHSLDAAMNFVKGQEFKETAEAIRKSGKAKFLGFSSHHKNRAPIIQAAADGGIIDAIMLQYTPWLDKDEPLNKALDACYNKGIGLISMKQIAGQFPSGIKRDMLAEVVKRAPMLAEKNTEPMQGLLHAIWTDERDQRLLRLDQDDRPAPRRLRRGQAVLASDHGRDRPTSRCGFGLWPNPVRRLRWSLLRCRRHQRRAGEPDPVPHLSRAPRHPLRSPTAVRRPLSRTTRLGRRRPRSGPGGLPEQA